MKASYPVKIEIFEGPLDLLLHLITKQEIDIYDIPIALITEQYVGYLRAMEELDLEVASEFVVMAATLMEIKARMLLPRPRPSVEDAEGGEDPRKEIVDMLLKYRVFKEAALRLKELEGEQCRRYTRPGMAPTAVQSDGQLEMGEVRLVDLVERWKDLLLRRKPVTENIPRENMSVGRKMREILRKISGLAAGVAIMFSTLVRAAAGRREIVVAFLALLELVRRGKVHVKQAGPFLDIEVYNSARMKGREA